MIGVVGAGEPAERLAAALADSGLEIATVAAEEAGGAEADLLVAAGEPALIDLAGAAPDVPVLPAGSDTGLPASPIKAVPSAVRAFLDGGAQTRDHPLLSVAVDGEPAGRALLDVTLVRSEPGRISEYSLEGGSASSRFRADGVVAATPAGSHGYARAAGGPRLGLEAAAVAVVPIAAFGLGASPWVLDPADGLTIRVERDEGDVSLLLDGRERARLAGPAAVTAHAEGALRAVVPPG